MRGDKAIEMRINKIWNWVKINDEAEGDELGCSQSFFKAFYKTL